MFSRSVFSRSAFSRSVFTRSAVCGLRFRGLCFRGLRSVVYVFEVCVFETPPDGHQHGVSIQISINLGKKFLRISRIRKLAVTWNLTRVFAYSPSFVSQNLDFIYAIVLILILVYFDLNGVALKTSNFAGRYKTSRWWVSWCKSKLRCQICDLKLHTSIYHKQETTNPLLVAAGIPTGNVTYPVVVVEVEGIKCRLGHGCRVFVRICLPFRSYVKH